MMGKHEFESLMSVVPPLFFLGGPLDMFTLLLMLSLSSWLSGPSAAVSIVTLKISRSLGHRPPTTLAT